jgi:hypothetical protein
MSQPEYVTTCDGILLAGKLCLKLDEVVKKAPELPTGTVAAEEVEAIKERRKSWPTELITFECKNKTVQLCRKVLEQAIAKGRIGAGRDVVSLMESLGFTAEEE